MKSHRYVSVAAAVVMAVTASAAHADISLEMVTVGNVGNANDTTGLGGVDHVYSIGKYEVTAGQYTAFLNGVATTDTYGLYNSAMTGTYGCQIVQSGSSGSYTYSVAGDRANRPVNYVSWGDAARFMNWLHNGQGNGSTEIGAYTLNGATGLADLMAVNRNADAKFWIPTANEWYKAAYHKNDGVTGNYWDYPTSSDNTPSNMLLAVDPGNSANFSLGGGAYTLGSPYYMTEVGEFENSGSPYGTFDQGGNVWEWNEAVNGEWRGVLGGSWYHGSVTLLASYPGDNEPTSEHIDVGFRVASVPEPGSLTLMLCGALAGLYWWRRRA